MNAMPSNSYGMEIETSLYRVGGETMLMIKLLICSCSGLKGLLCRIIAECLVNRGLVNNKIKQLRIKLNQVKMKDKLKVILQVQEEDSYKMNKFQMSNL